MDLKGCENIVEGFGEPNVQHLSSKGLVGD